MTYNCVFKNQNECLTKCKTLFYICVRQCVRQNVRHLNKIYINYVMASSITVRISDGMKAEIETIVGDIGLWHNQSHFVKDALDEYIKKYWEGDRFDNHY